jgi:transcriptional regulator with XRE-family HTH domain
MAVTAPPSAQPVVLVATIKAIRLRRGWSQSELALRTGCARTYIGKLEKFKVAPTLHSLEKLARGLDVTIAELLGESENKRTDQIRDLVADPYLVEMLPFTSKLDGLQLRTILVQVGQMVARPRRTA